MTQNQTYSKNCTKRKEKVTAARGLEIGPQAGPLCSAHAGAARVLSPLCTVTEERVPLVRPSSPLSLRDADGVTPPVSSFSATHGGTAAAPAAVSEVLGPRACAHQLRLDFATPLTPSTHALPYPFHLSHEKGGRPPWPTIGQPLGPGRVQTDGLGSFHGG